MRYSRIPQECAFRSTLPFFIPVLYVILSRLLRRGDVGLPKPVET